MPDTAAGLEARSDDAVLMVGTTRGAFLFRWSGGLGTPLADGREVVILPSVSGG